MLRAIILILLISACSLIGATPSPVIVITNVLVIPMDRERILAHQTVVVRDGKIAQMGSGRDVQPPPGAFVIQGQGRFLMPGLIDMHVHISDDEFPLYVANGITTVRNMNGSAQHLRWRDAIRRGEIIGPDLYTAGPLMTGEPVRFKIQALVKTPEQAAASVAEQKRLGFDFIKAYDGLSKESYAALTAAAKQAGLRVVGHIPESVGLEGVLAAGQSSIEHAEQFAYRSGFPDLDADRIPAVASMTARAGVWVCPTLAAIAEFGRYANQPESLWTRPEMKYVDPETLAWWKPALSGNPSFSQMLGWWDRKLVQALHTAGVKLLAGTDTPNPPMIPGFSLQDELRALVEAGLSPYEALEASTRNAAQFLGGDFGTVEVGKRADLILLRQNPLDNIANLSTRDGVMLRGQWFPQAELQKQVDTIAAGFQKTK